MTELMYTSQYQLPSIGGRWSVAVIRVTFNPNDFLSLLKPIISCLAKRQRIWSQRKVKRKRLFSSVERNRIWSVFPSILFRNALKYLKSICLILPQSGYLSGYKGICGLLGIVQNGWSSLPMNNLFVTLVITFQSLIGINVQFYMFNLHM